MQEETNELFPPNLAPVVKEVDVGLFHVAVWYFRNLSHLHIEVTRAGQLDILLQHVVATPTSLQALPTPQFTDADSEEENDDVLWEIVHVVREINDEEVAKGNTPVLESISRE